MSFRVTSAQLPQASAGQHFRTNVGCCVLLAGCPETGHQTRCSQTVSNARVASAQLPPGFRSCVGKFMISEACSILTDTNKILLPRYFRTASARACISTSNEIIRLSIYSVSYKAFSEVTHMYISLSLYIYIYVCIYMCVPK